MSFVERSAFGRSRRRFVVLVVVMLGIAVGHLLVLDGLTDVALGLPTWLWVQVAVVAMLFVLAWLATPRAEPEVNR